MADLIKEEPVQEEQQEQQASKKQLYKNWKTYAIALGIVVIGTGTGLGIYYGVNANNNETTPLTPQQVVKAISDTSYAIPFTTKTTVEGINSSITPQFIRELLGANAKASFDDSLFGFHSIMVGDQVLNAEHLASVTDTTPLVATINYTYDEIAATTNLNIAIAPVTTEDIITAIGATNYQLSTEVETTPADVIKQIDGKLIKDGLGFNPEVQNAFDVEKFDASSIKIMVKDKALADADLAKVTETPILSELTFKYNNVEAVTLLKITVTKAAVTAEDVVAAIADQTYVTTTKIGSSAQSITDAISADFIKAKLTGEIAEAFDGNLINLATVKVMVGEKALADTDLNKVSATPLKTTITFEYNKLATTTNLEITVTALPQQDVANGIAGQTYTTSTKTGSTVKNITDLITAEFIQVKLTGNIKESFDGSSFKFLKVTVDGHDLNAADLSKVGTLNAKISFEYGSIKNKEASFTITVTAA